MNKQELQPGTIVIYTGSPFEGFDEHAPQGTFLGYDSKGWHHAWIDYQGQQRMVSLTDIHIAQSAV